MKFSFEKKCLNILEMKTKKYSLIFIILKVSVYLRLFNTSEKKNNFKQPAFKWVLLCFFFILV